MQNLEEQKGKANAFRALHHSKTLLILPNVWDVVSARVIEEAGYPAVATTSAGIAFSLGYSDGQHISRDEMVARVGRISRAVKVPVTADAEAGYGHRPEDAAETARLVIEAGAVGMNFEDGTGNPEAPLVDLSLQIEHIQAIRQAALQTGVLLVLNARTDVYLDQVGTPETRYDRALRRLIAFRDAGADCVFAPGIRDTGTIGRLVKDLGCPLNILVGPGSPTIPELQTLGVARASLGSSAMRATLGLLGRIAEELKASGSYASLEGAPPHPDVNRMLS
ncbi:MAG: isocitrate lyase/phosphoenolpyruvate mutase family protein [Acidobacteriales bacterium]|nr:isocitrate lyase/phosphoenolpyruvate mutase family protein [Terriglobales bacterium]